MHIALKAVLREAVKLGGSSVNDYVDAEGREGFFQLRHRVYGREGQTLPGMRRRHQAGYHRRTQQSLLFALSEVAVPISFRRWKLRGAERLHMGVYSIGVDLGGTNLRIAAVDTDGKLLEKLTTGTEVGRGRDWVIGEMCDAIQSLQGPRARARPPMVW